MSQLEDLKTQTEKTFQPPSENIRYFIIRRYNCGSSNQTTDIIGLTTNEEYAKSRQSVFCGYEEVKHLK